jgi:hypothetical protein
MLLHWENWGYKRDVHYVVGHKPPRALNWPTPLITPDNYDNIITFYTGAIGQIISQDRTGTSNSKSFDFVDIDEAKFVDFDQLKNETFQANRGQIREFGHFARHHGMLITSDMSLTKKGSWFMNYESQCDQERCLLSCKDTNLKAIHNNYLSIRISDVVVFYLAIVHLTPRAPH